MKRTSISWLLLVAVAVSLWQPGAFAQPDFEGVDIVFVVDQSGSMSGTGASDQRATDPQELRFESVQYALDTLVAYRQSIAPDVEVRMAVIAFGDNTLEVLDWVDVSAYDDEVLWNQQRDVLINQLSASFFTTLLPEGETNLGNTNFLAGYETAAQAFQRIATDSSNRLGVVITITDGEPCVDEPPYENMCGNVVAQGAYMEDVLAFTQDAFPPANFDLYTIVLDDTGALWQTWQDEWSQIVRSPQRALRVDTSQQFGVAFLNILREVISKIGGGEDSAAPVVLTPGLNTVFVPPYQRSARISVFKSTASPGLLTITGPDGMPLHETEPSLTITNHDRPIEIWVISNPAPGNWTFEIGSTSDRMDVRLELIPVEVRVDVPEGPFLQHENVTVTLTLLDDAGAPLPRYAPPFDQLDVVSLVTAPDGTVNELLLTELIPGVYEGQISVEQAGNYQIGFRAEAGNGTGRPVVIYQNTAAGSLTVTGINLVVEGLPAGEDYLVNNTLGIQAEIADELGNPVSLTNQQVEVALIQGDSRTLQTLIPTEAIDETSGEVYTRYNVDIFLDTAGSYVLEVIASAADATGNPYEIGSLTASFNVLPSRPVALTITSPEDGSSNYARDGLFFELQPMILTFETRLEEDNSLVDIYDIALEPQNILSFSLLNADEEPIETEAVITGQAGQYSIDLSSLDRGTYTALLEMDGTLNERFVIQPQSRRVQVTFSRGINLQYVVAWVGIAVLGIATLGGLVSAVLRRQRRRPHPARGYLVIARVGDFGADVTRLRTIQLDGYKSNYIVLNRRVLPKETGLTRIVIECTDQNMSSRKRIRLTAYRGKESVVQQRALSPGNAVTLRPKAGAASMAETTYQIIKDPDDPEFGAF